MTTIANPRSSRVLLCRGGCGEEFHSDNHTSYVCGTCLMAGKGRQTQESFLEGDIDGAELPVAKGAHQ